MKRKEMREVTVTYCDYCGKELKKYNHYSIELPDFTVLQFCSDYTNNTTETCFDKYKKDQLTERKKQ